MAIQQADKLLKKHKDLHCAKVCYFITPLHLQIHLETLIGSSVCPSNSWSWNRSRNINNGLIVYERHVRLGFDISLNKSITLLVHTRLMSHCRCWRPSVCSALANTMKHSRWPRRWLFSNPPTTTPCRHWPSSTERCIDVSSGSIFQSFPKETWEHV